LGIPAWVLIPKISQWRYGESFESLPWYGKTRLYHQTDKWPIQKIVKDLKERFA
jgi:hypothetical protein